MQNKQTRWYHQAQPRLGFPHAATPASANHVTPRPPFLLDSIVAAPPGGMKGRARAWWAVHTLFLHVHLPNLDLMEVIYLSSQNEQEMSGDVCQLIEYLPSRHGHKVVGSIPQCHIAET